MRPVRIFEAGEVPRRFAEPYPWPDAAPAFPSRRENRGSPPRVDILGPGVV